MKLVGSFGVMSVTDLLQWIGTAKKTGCLEVQRRNVSRSIFCRDGRVVACSSADPLVLMGQFLLYNGWISEETLRRALKLQEETTENLGTILVAMDAIREDQLLQVVASKAMETIHGIFDWDNATFEFLPDVQPTPSTIEVELGIEEILLEGVRRLDEMREMRAVFPSQAVVLATTEIRPDPPMIASPMARRIYETIDGRKTLAEIMLGCRASEYRTCQFLLRLHDSGMVSVKEAEEAMPEPDAETQGLEKARELMGQGDTCAAFDILHRMSREHPGDTAVAALFSEVEAAMIAGLYCGELPPDAVPEMCRQREEVLALGLSPQELHLIDVIDGEVDVKGIVWIAPLTLAEILRALKKLIDRQVIRATVPNPSGAVPHGG